MIIDKIMIRFTKLNVYPQNTHETLYMESIVFQYGCLVSTESCQQNVAFRLFSRTEPGEHGNCLLRRSTRHNDVISLWCARMRSFEINKMHHHFVTPLRVVTKYYVIITLPTLVQLRLNLDVPTKRSEAFLTSPLKPISL